jgi:maleamate amidohydrolase
MSTDPYARTREIYAEQRVGGGTVGFGRRAAVLVVDFQHLYTRGRCATGLDAVERTRDLLAVARTAGVPVVYTYVGYDPEHPDGGVWAQKCPGLLENVRGTWPCGIDELVAPAPGDLVLEKRAASAFFGTGLAGHLRALGVDTVVVTGTSTSGCVRASVVDGVAWDFRMIVARECVSDRSQPSHDAALFDIDTKYGDVLDTAEVAARLAAPAEPPTDPARTGGTP